MSQRAALIRTEEVHHRYDGPDVLSGVSIAVGAGELVGLVGPNGSGKSTLLRVMAGLCRPRAGTVTLDGRPLRELSRRQVARTVAYVPQEFDLAFPFSALEVVLTGRHPHLSWLAIEGDTDVAIARRAMEIVGVDHLAERPYHALSGGERQRVVIAAALAQQPRLLLLDEPTANLDLRFQDAVLAVAHRMVRDGGLGVLLAIHDLNLALAWCTRLVVLCDGAVDADGPPAEVIDEARLARVWGGGARLLHLDGAPAVLPAGRPGGDDG